MKIWHKAVAVFVLVLFGIAASGAAFADHRGHGGGAHFGLYFGVPLYGPTYYPYYAPYYPPNYYYPPASVVYSAPPVYIEQSAAQATPAQGDWFYCAASKSYYPYVAECPGGWQRVPAQPTTR